MPPEETKKFTQAELGIKLSQDRKADRDKIERLTKELEDHRTLSEVAKSRVSELEGQLTSLGAERDAVRSELETSQAEHARAVGEMTAKNKTFRADLAITQALVASKVLPSAATFASNALHRESQIEQDAEGNLTGIVYGGKRYERAEDAAVAFLKANDYLAAGPTGRGAGTTLAQIGYSPQRKELLDPVAQAAEGWKQVPK